MLKNTNNSRRQAENFLQQASQMADFTRIAGIGLNCCVIDEPKPDFYVERASRMFNVPYALVTKEQRRLAKESLFLEAYSIKGDNNNATK